MGVADQHLLGTPIWPPLSFAFGGASSRAFWSHVRLLRNRVFAEFRSDWDWSAAAVTRVVI